MNGPLTTPRILPDLPADTYHRDDITDQPSLSASVAAILTSQSPAHARAAHPRLSPYLVREEKKAFDLGTTVHALLLEGRDPAEVIHVVEHDSWRTNAAKEQAAYAREQGRIPLLDKDCEDVLTMVAAAQRQIASYNAEPALLSDGKPEQTLVWDEDGVTCRSRLDWLRNDFAAIDDVKTSARTSEPKFFARKTVYAYSYDLRAAMYLRGVKATSGVDALWRWIVVETTTPYALTVVTPNEDMLAIGNAKFDYALEMWRDCLASGVWPAYTTDVHVAEPPPWELRWLDNSQEYEEAAWAQM